MNTILVVEDDIDTLELIRVSLSNRGFTVRTAANLYSALDVLKTRQPIDAMLLDYNMPGMRAEDFLREVHALKPQLPIVLTSAVVDAREKARHLGLSCYIQKPFDTEQLLDVLKRATKADAEPMKSSDIQKERDSASMFPPNTGRVALEIKPDEPEAGS